MTYLVCGKGPMVFRAFLDFLSQDPPPDGDWEFIDSPLELTAERLDSLKPEYVFFPHWSWIIPREIWENHRCVVFHLGDLPEGRGGSPLQNHIARGIYSPCLTAVKVDSGIDTGPVYGKWPVDLRHGTAFEILSCMYDTIFLKAIPYILKENPSPLPQEGEGSFFQRRTPEESDISSLKTLNQVYDWIRMLDCPGYPRAFLDMGPLRLEFSRASLGPDEVAADVRFFIRR